MSTTNSCHSFSPGLICIAKLCVGCFYIGRNKNMYVMEKNTDICFISCYSIQQGPSFSYVSNLDCSMCV